MLVYFNVDTLLYIGDLAVHEGIERILLAYDPDDVAWPAWNLRVGA